MEKSTGSLEYILEHTSPDRMEDFLTENQESMLDPATAFSDYMRETIKKKEISQVEVFRKANLSEKFGYKLISGEKHTRQRDVILRLCIASGFTLGETQKALRLYGMAPLYPRLRRDALIMVQLGSWKRDISAVNASLKQYGEEPLQETGEDK